jgi:hypothetical protein
MDARLPNFCALRDNASGGIIIVKKGETGYWPGSRMALETDEDVARFNEQHGASAGAAQAMHFGSMFGWDTPGATLEAGEDMAKRQAAKAN